MFSLFTKGFSSWSSTGTPSPIRVVQLDTNQPGVGSGVISSTSTAHVRAPPLLPSTHLNSASNNTEQSSASRPAKRRKVLNASAGADRMKGAGAAPSPRKGSVVSPLETKVHASRATDSKRGKRDAKTLDAAKASKSEVVRIPEDNLKLDAPIQITDRDLTAAKESVSVRQMAHIQSVIEKEMCLEILYKHGELERIDQEIAKCQVALEQLQRCQEQGFAATSGRLEDMRLLTERSASFSLDTPTVRDLDSPFTKPYRSWLDDPTSGFRSASTSQCENCAPGQFRLLDNPHMTRNRNTSTASTSMQALPLGYPKPRRDKAHLGPVIMKRSDGETVKLQCPQCKREDFANVQGFVNHCRITKHSPSELKTHEDAATVCGILVDEAESAAAQSQNSAVLVMNRVEWKVPSGKSSAQGSGSKSSKGTASSEAQSQSKKPVDTTQPQVESETVIDGQVSAKAVEEALSENSALSQKCKASGLLDDFLAFGEEHRLSKQAAEDAMSEDDAEETNENEENEDDDDNRTVICASPTEHATPRKRKPASRRSIPLKLHATHGTAALLSVDEADNDPMDLDYQTSPTGSHHSGHSFAHDAPSLTTDDDDEHDTHSARSLTAEPEKSLTRTRDADAHDTDESEHSRTASDKENIYTVKIDLGSKKSKPKSPKSTPQQAESKRRRGRPKKVEIVQEDDLMDEELEEVHLVDTKAINDESPKQRKTKPPMTTTITNKSKTNGRKR